MDLQFHTENYYKLHVKLFLSILRDSEKVFLKIQFKYRMAV
jgi:hypothetical protein